MDAHKSAFLFFSIILVIAIAMFVNASLSNRPSASECSSIMIVNSNRTIEPLEMQTGDTFYGMRLHNVLYGYNYNEGVRYPNYAVFTGSRIVSGTLINTGDIWDYILVIDDEYRGYLPVFDVEKPRLYAFIVLDMLTATGVHISAFDRTDMTGYRAVFRINYLITTIDPNVYDAISGRFIRIAR